MDVMNSFPYCVSPKRCPRDSNTHHHGSSSSNKIATLLEAGDKAEVLKYFNRKYKAYKEVKEKLRKSEEEKASLAKKVNELSEKSNQCDRLGKGNELEKSLSLEDLALLDVKLEVAVRAVRKEMLRRLTEKDICKICCENKIEVVLVPCGHFALCSQCSSKVKKCPLCRVRIDKKMKVYSA